MTEKQKEIMEALHTQPKMNPTAEIKRRIDFLKLYVKKAGAKGFVLGISGGQDSSLAAKLAQMAVKQLNEETQEGGYQFHAIRLPYGEQHDEDDAKVALSFIGTDHVHTVNIKPAVDASNQAFQEAVEDSLSNFLKGNTKARERMKVQFDIAAHFGCLVIGTDHAAEAVTGFFTKFGDGACDIVPLFGLNKRQGRALLKELGAPKELYTKVPTADLEDDKPGLPDEEALGMTYEQIDDYLEGKEIDAEIAKKLEERYDKTEHKRQQPPSLYDVWWKS
ncbi:ammonia-dependent NAD(+) synthetase [Shouchella shacheensis]|uniref:ammonia-dependent NAD(+) synthetase n=1 Tax=Shouchella shacheensis TaxID=1649580 RepID=UPI0007403B04|nr:ammonia-dependent NAD(+) synthetase [Shouchella shacheensis]